MHPIQCRSETTRAIDFGSHATAGWGRVVGPHDKCSGSLDLGALRSLDQLEACTLPISIHENEPSRSGSYEVDWDSLVAVHQVLLHHTILTLTDCPALALLVQDRVRVFTAKLI